jgi:hypothetical protein
MTFIDGILVGLLAASLVALVAQWRAHRRSITAALQHEERLLDRARAAELRSDQQIDRMLERVHTAPRLEMTQGATTVAVDPAERTFISDLPTDDEAWNDLTGEAEDEDIS